MAKKKNYEFREKDYNRNSEGLKQRRLKEEARWKFNPNESYEEDLDEDIEDLYDEYEERDYR